MCRFLLLGQGITAALYFPQKGLICCFFGSVYTSTIMHQGRCISLSSAVPDNESVLHMLLGSFSSASRHHNVHHSYCSNVRFFCSMLFFLLFYSEVLLFVLDLFVFELSVGELPSSTDARSLVLRQDSPSNDLQVGIFVSSVQTNLGLPRARGTC